MKLRRSQLRQLERFTRARVVPLILAVLIVFSGTNTLLESVAMSGMTHHHHGTSECLAKTGSENSSRKNYVHEHCQFCFAPALASGVPNKFSISRLTVTDTLKLEPFHQIVFNHFYHQLAAPRAPPIQA
jgi:hypothetical protein